MVFCVSRIPWSLWRYMYSIAPNLKRALTRDRNTSVGSRWNPAGLQRDSGFQVVPAALQWDPEFHVAPSGLQRDPRAPGGTPQGAIQIQPGAL